MFCDVHVLVHAAYPPVYRSCETLQLGQAHVSKQASQVLQPDGTARDTSDNDTELLILKRYDVIPPHLNTIDGMHFDLFVRSFCTFKLLCLHLGILKKHVSFHYQLNS